MILPYIRLPNERVLVYILIGICRRVSFQRIHYDFLKPDRENAVPTTCFQAPESLRRAVTARPRSPEAPVTTTVEVLVMARETDGDGVRLQKSLLFRSEEWCLFCLYSFGFFLPLAHYYVTALG